jgi:hypothetical protein
MIAVLIEAIAVTFRAVGRRNGDVDVVSDGESALGQSFGVVRRFRAGDRRSDLTHVVNVTFRKESILLTATEED